MLTSAARVTSRSFGRLLDRLDRDFGDVLPDADGVLRLRSGDTGPEVEDWQNNLAALGFAVGVSTTFDAATLAATTSFQSSRGLTPSGVVDDATRQRMADELDTRELPKSGTVAPVSLDPVLIGGRFPWWGWLAVPIIGAAVLAKRRKKK